MLRKYCFVVMDHSFLNSMAKYKFCYSLDLPWCMFFVLETLLSKFIIQNYIIIYIYSEIIEKYYFGRQIKCENHFTRTILEFLMLNMKGNVLRKKKKKMHFYSLYLVVNGSF